MANWMFVAPRKGLTLLSDARPCPLCVVASRAALHFLPELLSLLIFTFATLTCHISPVAKDEKKLSMRDAGDARWITNIRNTQI